MAEGQKDTLCRYFTMLDFVLQETYRAQAYFQEEVKEYPDRDEFTILATGAATAWEKAETYYNLVDESPTYYAFHVLRPAKKWL